MNKSEMGFCAPVEINRKIKTSVEWYFSVEVNLLGFVELEFFVLFTFKFRKFVTFSQ
jgi:hypothetical protein